MDYQQLHKCIEVLQNKSTWFFTKNKIDEKVKCLEIIKERGSPNHIHFLLPLLKDAHELIKVKASEAIVHLFYKLTSQNSLYDSLKYLDIDKGDLQDYKNHFPKDTYIVLLAIASMNKNGYVREKAIQELTATKSPQVIKYILFRLNDWVAAVRQTAIIAIKAFFDEPYIAHFIYQLPLIERLLKVERVNLSLIYDEIIDYTVEKELTKDFYRTLSDDKVRLLYSKHYIKRKGLDEKIIALLLSDNNYLIRNELLTHIDLVTTQKQLLQRLLYDKSARVRRNALYAAKPYLEDLLSDVITMASDESASVREVSRYLLKNRNIDFAEQYRQQLKSNQLLIGSVFGLSETGTKADLPLFQQYIHHPSLKLGLACLLAIHRVEPAASKAYCLQWLTHDSRKIRTKCIDILSVYADNEVLEKARRIFQIGDYEQKKTVLKLFNQVGGWRVLPDLIGALTDDNENIQNLGWLFLQKWRMKASTLFSSPSPTDLQRAIDAYGSLDKSRTKMTYYREKLWEELPFFLSQ